MGKEDKLKIVLPVLILIAVVVWIWPLISGGSRRNYKMNKAGLKASTDDSQLSALIVAGTPGQARMKSVYTVWKRNPFMLKAVSYSANNEVVLNGILWDSYSPRALINDKILGKGDKINQYTVYDIQQDKIILSDGVNNLELRMAK